MRHATGWNTALVLLAVAWTLACGGSSPTAPTQQSTTTSVVIPSAVTVSGQLSFAAAGGTSQLTAKATYADGSSRDVTSGCTWQSNNVAIATVSQTGLLTVRGAGTTWITATYDGWTGGAVVAVRALDLPAEIPLVPALLVSSWRNVDLNTGGVTQADVGADSSGFAVRLWGACVPTACDLGEETTPFSDGDDGLLSLTWQLSFAVKRIEIRLLKDGRLEVWCHTHFTDTSGRQDYDSVDYLRKFE
jgi:hypothetical protein